MSGLLDGYLRHHDRCQVRADGACNCEVGKIPRRIATLKAENVSALTALHFPGGHLRPDDKEPCHYVGSPCNQCGYVDPRDVELHRYREVLRWIVRQRRDSPEWIDGVRRVAHNALCGIGLKESNALEENL